MTLSYCQNTNTKLYQSSITIIQITQWYKYKYIIVNKNQAYNDSFIEQNSFGDKSFYEFG